jgi:hypothetical protein
MARSWLVDGAKEEGIPVPRQVDFELRQRMLTQHIPTGGAEMRMAKPEERAASGEECQGLI